MLKRRIIPVLLLKDTGLVKGVGFDHSRRVGSVLPSVKVYNNREVDELLILDVSATLRKTAPDFNLIESIAPYCLMPLTIGGGIYEIEHIHRLLQIGADKICLNTAAWNNPDIITEAACRYGSQCIIVSIDVRKNGDVYDCYSHSGNVRQLTNLVEWAQRVEEAGAGEILVTSIDRDGSRAGYDIELGRMVSEAVHIPVILSGGAGHVSHAAEAFFQTKISAIAAASLFHFTATTPLDVKKHLAGINIPVRRVVTL